jgi:hypothetical protein
MDLRGGGAPHGGATRTVPRQPGILEIVAPERLVSTEQFEKAWYRRAQHRSDREERKDHTDPDLALRVREARDGAEVRNGTGVEKV